eukprot:CAMPEP_0113647790 /NCGR_PEP_ID=MMETSP0017_2-20120614/25322_1 /TAXON_ID=2856 /ORGANISM="Cylindrotheca closterium" /LENGTH=1578 /DNA_ID=CAMNT_0000559917 /DNA_START=812 /DNA_END=5548 /DNA_ORIENTATION=+ /assembly_acc=CAM_ASM_000147
MEDDDSQGGQDTEIPEEWKELFHESNIKEVDIETIKKWMNHPNKDTFINLKNDSTQDGKTMLLCTILYQRLDVAKLLLEHGADPNISDKDGDTPLIDASMYGNTNIVELLLEKGADPNVCIKNGDTALYIASNKGHTEVVKLLLEKGVDPNVCKMNGRIPLIRASSKGHTDVAKLLLEKGVDPNICDKAGKTSLIGASSKGYTDVAKLLLHKGADPNISSNNYRATPLIVASSGGHGDIAKLLLDKGADPNIYDEDGDTPLIIASREGRTNIAKLLLEKGADPNIYDMDGDTPLVWGSNNGHTNVTKLLLEQGADPNIDDEDGDTPLIVSSREGHIDIVKLLLEKGVDPNISNEDGDTPLIRASINGHASIVALLLEKGADPNICNRTGDTPLIVASSKGHTDVAKLLLEKGVDPDICNKDRDTPLIRASREGHSKIAKLLLEKGAAPNIKNKDWDTPLIRASRKGHSDIAKLLLEKGVDPNISDIYGDTPLIVTSMEGRTDVAKLLLENGADPSISNEGGDTALMWASSKGHADIAKLLLEKGVDPSICDKAGDTPLHLASSNGLTDVAKLLLEKGADPNICGEDGHTPLMYASRKAYTDLVELLLEKGADPNICDEDEDTALNIASGEGHTYIAKLLLAKGAAPNISKFQEFFDDCSEGKKNPVSPLEDIIHDIVQYPFYANKFLELYQENHDIVNWLDKDGRTVRQVACKECREVTLFMGRYDLEDQPKYESPTCKVYNALDLGGSHSTTEHKPVVMKFIEKEEHFVNEMQARRNDDGSPRFSAEFVTPDLDSYRADQDADYADACKTWKLQGAEANLLPDYCVVMERGERSLLQAMNAENLSAKSKDLQRREILLILCKIFSYLHDSGYVHGDVKAHNVVRHIGQNVTWKAIDFDACAKIGDAVGLKLTTGSAPPEMLKIVNGSKVILRQPGAGLDESDLVLADPSFDTWSYGILMYQLVTGRSFFHSDLQGNLDDEGLKDLANLTQSGIHERLGSVEDVNARVLLSRILRLDPSERPTMSEIEQDYYFHPSESPQGRKAEFFGKQVFSIFVPQVDEEPKRTERFENGEDDCEIKTKNQLLEEKRAKRIENGEVDGESKVEDIARFLSANGAEFSYHKLRDEDKDWSDKLLNSEVETFDFDKLEGMGEKPQLIDGDAIYTSNYLRGLLSSKGPDYFMGFLVEYFELYKIMNDAHAVCQGIKANIVSDVKSLKGIFIKLFVRGKGLNDVLRGTLFCNSIDQFKYVGRQMKEQYGYNVYIKPPKTEAGAWPIPKLLIYGNRRLDGRCMSVEIQFSTVYMHLATHASNNHLVYESIREATGYLGDKDREFQEFLQLLNEQYIDTEGFLRNHNEQDGRFEVLVEEEGEGNHDGSGEMSCQKSDDRQCSTKQSGFILSGRIRCGDRKFQFMSPKDHMQRFSESSFVVNKSLTLLSNHSYWSDKAYDLEGKSVEFAVSFKERGLAIVGIGTAKCLHGDRESGEGGDRCSVHVGRSKFTIRKNGVEKVFREKKLPDQVRAKIILKMKDGHLFVSFVGSNKEGAQELETAQVSMPPDHRYYLYMRSPPGVHDVKFHDININE